MNRNTTAAVKTLPLCDVIRRLIENGALVKAEEAAAKAMGEYPHSPEPHNLMGIVLEKENEHVEAMKHFRAAWALDPTYLPARVNMEQYAGFSTVGRIDAYDESDCPGEDVKTQETAEIACDPRGISRIFKRNRRLHLPDPICKNRPSRRSCWVLPAAPGFRSFFRCFLSATREMSGRQESEVLSHSQPPGVHGRALRSEGHGALFP